MFESLLPLDFAVNNAVQAIANPAITLLMQAASVIFSAGGVMAIAAWLYWSRKEKDSFYFVNLAALSALFSEAFKQFFQRLRPEFSGQKIQTFENHAINDYSFPSGHATLAGAVYSYLEKGLKKHEKALLAIAVLTVAFSRVYLGAHFLTDVLAGLLLGYFVGKLNLWLRKNTEHMHFKLTRFREEVLLFAFVIISVIIIIFLQELVLAAAVIGYFAGYSLLKEMRIEQSGKSLKRKLAGFACLGIIYAGTFNQDLQLKFISFFLIGFWITFLYPLGYESLKHHVKGRRKKKH